MFRRSQSNITANGWLLVGLLIWAPQLVARPALNDLEVPSTKADLLDIQTSMQEHLERVRAATVCVVLGDNEGSGSAVIISETGLVMTAAHVSTGVGRELKVLMEDGSEHKAVSLGLDSTSDAALIQITSEGDFPYVEWDREGTTELGDWVFALGHSGGFDKERGSVVRLGRVIRIEETTMQSDCKLIGGDSGGPLFNLDGVLVGIHSRVAAELEGNLHVPMGEFITHWDEMEAGEFLGEGPYAEKPQKGTAFLGAGFDEKPEGLRIREFSDDSTLSEGGAQVGDVLLSLNGEMMTLVQEVIDFMKEKTAGEKVTVQLMREGETMEIVIVLGKR